jgi:hypothetical protein
MNCRALEAEERTMRNWLGVVIAVGLGGVLSVACSSSSSDKYGSSDSFCSAKAVEECQIAAACAVDAAACKTKRAALCNQHATDVASSGRKYTSGNAQACIDKMHKLYSTQTITPSALADATDTCERVFSGTVANNAACKTSYDCASTSSICDKGLCGTKTTKNVGDGCANAGEVCGGDSYCSKTTPNVCLAKKASGQPCDADNPCSTTAALRCDNTCKDAYPAGHVCATDADCATAAPFCDVYNGNICDLGMIFAPAEKALCAQYGG